MAQHLGVSKSTISNVWRSHNLKPHLSKTFKLSRDRRFLEKLTDVVGLYLNPPQHALVLCVDEKSQIQALDRTQPGLPFKKGRCGTMTHDYKRHGTTTLFAALEVLQGTVIGQCYARHRHQEFVRFLRRLDHEFPGDTPLHLVMDNYGTHTHPTVKAWRPASAVRSALCADQCQLAQPRGTLVWRTDVETHPPGLLSQRRRSDCRDRGILGGVERQSEALSLDRHATPSSTNWLVVVRPSSRFSRAVLDPSQAAQCPVNSWTLH